MTDELTAGRELDALILSRVMGQKYVFIDTPLPHYSTRIEDAWQVVEKLVAQGIRVIIGSCSGRWDVIAERGLLERPSVVAPTAPLAICRAALKVMEGGPHA